MDLDIASHQARAYTVATPVYEGPLDLLLSLIERAELDITRLALAQVTDQYLQHLRTMQDSRADEVSAFLVIAAKLIQIKSEALLPRPVVREEGEEDPAEALAQQLREYKRFKQAARFLEQREAAGLRTHLRVAPPPKVEGVVDLTGLDIQDLAAAARAILAADRRPVLASVVAAPRVTIREKISLIAGMLRSFGRTTFGRLLARRPTGLDAVVTFLAMLELIKRQLIQASQDRMFGDITIEPSADWDENENFELEFGE